MNPDVSELQQRLLAWYTSNARDLPWRNTTDPYAILVSEVLLQQTQVSRGLGYYLRFMAAFPTPQALAEAPMAAVLKAWEGAGYYARARNLQRAAQQIAAMPEFPGSSAQLRLLPGIGPYTAAAVASIANNEAIAAIDGNVTRVLARWFAMPKPTTTWLEHHASAVLDHTQPGTWNQAMMELGATVCTPKSPRCGQCPVRNHCQAYMTSQVSSIPTPKVRPNKREVRALAIIIGNKHDVYLEQRPASGLLGGLFGLPLEQVATASANDAHQGLFCLLERLGIAHCRAEVQHIGMVEHTMTHKQFTVAVYWLPTSPITSPQHMQHLHLSTVETTAIARLDHKMLALLPVFDEQFGLFNLSDSI
jgi:A/G-specific adenine glycosylase